MKVLLVVESGDRLWMDGVSVERWQGVLWEEDPPPDERHCTQRQCTLFVYRVVLEETTPLPAVGDATAR